MPRILALLVVGFFGSIYMGVSKNRGIPKSSILIGFSIINHPFWGTTFFWKHPYRTAWKSNGWNTNFREVWFRFSFSIR